MVVAGVYRLDELGHAVPGHAGVLELVAAGADGHVEAVEIGAVVDRDPVVAHVVQIHHALALVRHAHRWQASAQPQDLRLPLLGAEPLVVVVGVHPVLGVAAGVGAAHQDVVAGLRAEVDAVVVVGDVEAVVFVVVGGRPRRVVHLVTKRPGLDVHRVVDAGHLVDQVRVRPGDVHHDRRGHSRAVVEGHARDPPVAPADTGHGGGEAELGAGRLRGPLQVVGGQLRITHIARLGREDRAGQVLGGVGPEVGVVGPLRRTEDAGVEDGHASQQFGRRPVLVGNPDRVEVGEHLQVMAAGILECRHAALLVGDEAEFVTGFEVVGPLQPVLQALVRHGHAGEGGVREAHDGARVDGGAESRGRQLVHAQGAPSPPAELEGDGCADDTRADHHRVEAVGGRVRCPSCG